MAARATNPPARSFAPVEVAAPIAADSPHASECSSLDALPIIEPLCSVFRRKLKSEGLKYTPERAQMLETVIRLGASDALFTADRILVDVRAAGFDVSKATMYRTLKLLIDARIIERALSTTDQATFRCVFGEAVSQATGDVALLRPGHPPAPIPDAELRQSLAAACEAWCKRQGVQYAGYRVEIHAR
jgi:hypothetical protein